MGAGIKFYRNRGRIDCTGFADKCFEVTGRMVALQLLLNGLISGYFRGVCRLNFRLFPGREFVGRINLLKHQLVTALRVRMNAPEERKNTQYENPETQSGRS